MVADGSPPPVRARRQSKDPLEFYRTPPEPILSILPHLPAFETACDPCAGDGALLKVLDEQTRAKLWGIEIDPKRAAANVCRSTRFAVADALDPKTAWPKVQLYIFNAPFSLAEAFIRRALMEASSHRATVATLVRLGFLETAGRARLHREHQSDLFPLASRPSFTGGGTDGTAYGWLVFGPGRGGRWQLLERVSAE